MNVPLSVPQTIAVLRTRYPEALVCVERARLLAAQAHSYAASNLTDEARLAYVCAECRQGATEASQANAARRANLEAARATRRDTRVSLREALPEPLTGGHLQYTKVSTAAPLAARRKRGGRIALSTDAKRRGRRESQRRWRAAHTAAPVAA